jgi:urea transport system ATP-binding protein
MMSSVTIIYMEDVTVDFSGFKALNKVNFYMDRGELRFLIGPNGAGKTTLLDVICGKTKPTDGRVVFRDGINIRGLSEYKIARCGVSRKFQTPSIFENLTVFENMELSLRNRGGIIASFFSSLRKEDFERIHSVLKTTDLHEKGDQKAGSLSHGEKQWLEIGMTIMQDPELLLVDEPVAGMTGKERTRTGEMLMEIARDRSVLVVEHDMNFVKRFAKTVTVLHEGRLLCEGTFEKVQNDPVVIDVYLGRGGEDVEHAVA